MDNSSTVVSHWHTLVDDFNTSSLDFYKVVGEAVNAREVPEVTFDRVLYREGGFATAKREYLRLRRGALVFDVCAAPYGTSFFFSWWLVRTGPKHPLLYLVGFCFALLFFPPILSAPFGFGAIVMYPVMILLTVVGLALLARRGVFGPEEHLLFVPAIGWIYEKLFHPVTYYALDTTLMFQDSVHRAVTDTIEGLLDAQGLQALSEEARRPTMRSLTA